MKRHRITLPPLRRVALACITTSALCLAGCGGGGDMVAVVPSGGGSGVPVAVVAQGEVSSLAPLTVSGVGFSYTPSAVAIDDGDDDGRGPLLGMVVRAQGGQSPGGPLSSTVEPGLASSVRSSAELRGPAELVPSLGALPTVRVLGVGIQTTAATRYDSVAPGLGDVEAGQRLQVHGYPTPDGRLIATRIQRRSADTVTKSTGAVSYAFCSPSCDPSGTVIQVGTQTWRVSRDVVRELPFPLPEGTLVRVRSTSAALPGAVPVASDITAYAGTALLQDAVTSMRGVVSAPFATATESGFVLNGLRVVWDASVGTGRPDFSAGTLVEVQGRHRSGQITISSARLLGD